MNKLILGPYRSVTDGMWWADNTVGSRNIVALFPLAPNYDGESYHRVSMDPCEITYSEFRSKYSALYIDVIDREPAIEHCYDLADSRTKYTDSLYRLRNSQLLKIVRHESDTALSRCAKAHAMDELHTRGLAEFNGKELILK